MAINKKQIQRSASKALMAVSELMVDVIYTKTEIGEYNPETGQKDQVITNHPLRALVMSYEASQVDGVNIQATDLQFLFERTLMYFDPEIGESIKFNGKTYQVFTLIQDPADATLTAQGRR